MKILILEDEDVLARVLEEKLNKFNFIIRIAEDADTAISLVKSFKPDIILLDLMLPGKDGFTVIKEVKSASDTKRIPILVISNLSDDESIKKALQMGASDYFVKANHPIMEIVEKVKGVLLKSK